MEGLESSGEEFILYLVDHWGLLKGNGMTGLEKNSSGSGV